MKKKTKTYECQRCSFNTDRKFNWTTHVKSNKHRGIRKPRREYACHKCNYTTLDNSNYHKHCRTKKHGEQLALSKWG